MMSLRVLIPVSLLALLCLALPTSVSAHSWLDCADCRRQGDNKWASCDCKGRPRRFVQNVAEFGSQNWARHYIHSLDRDPACPNGQRPIGINPQFPDERAKNEQLGSVQSMYGGQYGAMTVAKPGQELCLRWPAKNHGNGDQKGDSNNPNKVYVNWNPTAEGQDFGTSKEWLKYSIANPAFENCDAGDSDKKACGGCFRVPNNASPGRHSVHWLWFFFNQWYGNCFDVLVTNSNNPNPATNNQPAAASGAGTIQSRAGNLCLDVTDGNFNNGTPVQAWTCSNNPNQQFVYKKSTGDLTVGGKCVDVKDNQLENGGKLQLWDCSGAANQKFDLNNGRLQVRGKDLCVDITDLKLVDGTPLQVWQCFDAQNQLWNVRANGITNQVAEMDSADEEDTEAEDDASPVEVHANTTAPIRQHHSKPKARSHRKPHHARRHHAKPEGEQEEAEKLEQLEKRVASVVERLSELMEEKEEGSDDSFAMADVADVGAEAAEAEQAMSTCPGVTCISIHSASVCRSCGCKPKNCSLNSGGRK